MNTAQNHPEITKQYLDSILRYDPISGLFYWVLTRCSVAKAGSIAGTIRPDGYTRLRVKGRLHYAHRLAWLAYYGFNTQLEIDHIDQNRLNNSIVNLRQVTRQDNQKNKCINVKNRSGVLGVHFFKERNKWVASISLNNKNVYLGIYESFFDAVCIRKSAEIRYDFHKNHGLKGKS